MVSVNTTVVVRAITVWLQDMQLAGEAMDEFSGLVIPTFFVNSVVRIVQVGPCLKIYQGQRAYRATGTCIPEVATVWPISDLTVAMGPMWEFLHAADMQPAVTYQRMAS